MEDQLLIDRYFDRDESALQDTKEQYGKLCFRIAHNILGSAADAEECVNDTWLGLWHTIPPQRPRNFTAFVCKMTRNLSLKRLAYNRAEKRYSPTVLPLSELEAVLPDQRIGPAWEARELGLLIDRFLREQPETARRVFIRRYWYMDPVAEIARSYGFTDSKIKSMLYRTRKRLRTYLEQEGVSL